MKKFLIPLLCTAILLLCGGCDLSDKVRIGTAAEGGNYYILDVYKRQDRGYAWLRLFLW